jgi:hypothetical protein
MATTSYPLLQTINDPADVRKLSRADLKVLATELRGFVLESVSQTGGHLSSNLGTVELTVALHHVFNTPEDRLVWDVGHQTYPHKILTGRLDRRDVKHIGCRQFGMQALLKGIYVHKDLLFLHISLANSSHVPFDIDFVRFKVVDKKVAKRTAQQETYIEPVRALNELRRIEGKGEGRIVYAFHKVVIPDDKLIEVEIYEKGGGRHQRFHIENSDLVDAGLVDELIKE